MGLDQYAHIRKQEIDWDKVYSDEHKPEKDGFVWRKHARLQVFMRDLFNEKHGTKSSEGAYGLGFNGEDLELKIEDIEKLEKAIEDNYYSYFASDGFFWGQQFQEESCKEYKDQDLKFVAWCKDQIKQGSVITYYCSW